MSSQELPDNHEIDVLHRLRDIASRNDERIKLLIERNEELSTDYDKVKNDLTDIQNTIIEIHQEIKSVKTRLDKIDGIWDKIFDSAWKIILMIIGGAILYYLGLQSPPT